MGDEGGGVFCNIAHVLIQKNKKTSNHRRFRVLPAASIVPEYRVECSNIFWLNQLWGTAVSRVRGTEYMCTALLNFLSMRNT